MTDPTAPPVLSPLLTLEEWRFQNCGYNFHAMAREIDAQRAEVARLTAERDHWRDQFDLLRADLAWTPSEQANEISRLTNTLNDAGAKLARLTQENETLKKTESSGD